jgi:PIN domain nuclease of toxin-antitoxin system
VCVTRGCRLAREELIAADTAPLVSVAGLWELAIKAGLGRIDLPRGAEHFIGMVVERGGFELLPLTISHTTRVVSLPFPATGHRDPFDRLLIAQCHVEGLTFVTADAQLAEYGIHVLW